VGPYVVDARGTLPRFKEDASVAAGLDVAADTLPTRGLGVAAAIHVYPLRRRGVTIGIGGEWLLARGSRGPEAPDGNDEEPDPAPEGSTVTTRLSSLAPQISLNFGTRDGWSYVSGGMGLASLSSERDEAPFADGGGRRRAINYGGGARWFARPRLAFTFDVRFYSIAAREASAGRPAYPSTRLMVFSAGASFR
jgi:hypothetical protein